MKSYKLYKKYKNMIIGINKNNNEDFAVFQKDEWSYGDGLRNEEINGSLKDCQEFIECYNVQ